MRAGACLLMAVALDQVPDVVLGTSASFRAHHVPAPTERTEFKFLSTLTRKGTHRIAIMCEGVPYLALYISGVGMSMWTEEAYPSSLS